MILIVIVVVILLWMWQQKQKHIKEAFYPAWNDYVVYSQLSRRLKVGMATATAGHLSWLKDNAAINTDTLLFESERDAIHHLLVTKKVDVIAVSEAQYGMFLLSQLPREVAKSRAQILAHKHILLQNSTTRRLLTLDPVYHLLVAANRPFSTPSIVQIAHLTNDIQVLEKAMLHGAPGGPFRFMHTDAPDVSHMRSDAYFYDHYGQAPNAQFYQNTLYNNSTVQDCTQPLPDKYFFFQKDQLSLKDYPHLVQRRQLQPEPHTLRCFSSKMLLLTRTDVPVEWVHLFVQSIIPIQQTLSTSSALQDFVSLHQTLRSF